MNKSRTLKIFRNCSIYMIYVVVVFTMLFKIGEVKRIVTFNVSGVNSLKSSHMVDKYVPKRIEEEKKVQMPVITKYRLTSYYHNDELNSGACTGTGLCTWDFTPNEKGWLTYKGKLVIAAATTYLQKTFGTVEGRTYFTYYDEVKLTIDGVEYPGIILDTCGACYKDTRVDLFVKDSKSVIDRGYMGRNMISVEITKKK